MEHKPEQEINQVFVRCCVSVITASVDAYSCYSVKKISQSIAKTRRALYDRKVLFWRNKTDKIRHWHQHLTWLKIVGNAVAAWQYFSIDKPTILHAPHLDIRRYSWREKVHLQIASLLTENRYSCIVSHLRTGFIIDDSESIANILHAFILTRESFATFFI